MWSAWCSCQNQGNIILMKKKGIAVVASAGPGTLGSDGFVSIGGKEETVT